MRFPHKKEAALQKQGRKDTLAAETAQLAEDLPDEAAIKVTKHTIDLLFGFVSRRQLGL